MPTEQLKVVNMISSTLFFCDNMVYLNVVFLKMGLATITISTLFTIQFCFIY